MLRNNNQLVYHPIYSSNYQTLISKADACYKEENFNEALQYYLAARRKNKTDAECYKNISYCYSKLGNKENAVKAIDKALALSSSDATYWYRKSYYLNCLKKYSEAVICLDKTIALASPNHAVYYSKGYAYYKMERYKEAIIAFEQALNYSWDEPSTFHFLACAQQESGLAYEAIKNFNKALDTVSYQESYHVKEKKTLSRHSHDYSRAIQYKSNSYGYSDANSYSDSEEDNIPYAHAIVPYRKESSRSLWVTRYRIVYTTVLTNDELRKIAFKRRAHSKIMIKRFKDALNDCNLALAIDNQYSEAYYEMAHAYRSLKQYEEALLCINKASEFGFPELEVLLFKTNILSSLERYKETLPFYRRIIELDNEDAKAWQGLGIAYQCFEQHDKAIFYFDKAIEYKIQDPICWLQTSISWFVLDKLDLATSMLNLVKPEIYKNQYGNILSGYYSLCSGNVDESLLVFKTILPTSLSVCEKLLLNEAAKLFDSYKTEKLFTDLHFKNLDRILEVNSKNFSDLEYRLVNILIRCSMNYLNRLTNEKQKSNLNFSDYYIDQTKIKINKYFSEGRYGRIYIGKYVNEIVAIKQLKTVNVLLSSDAKKSLNNEVNLMAKYNHPNIVKFYGVYQDREGHCCIVMQYMSQGSLHANLHNSILSISWGAKHCKIALDIAEGLEFLHSKGIVHRDLKSANILLTKDLRAKISDFGSVRLAAETTVNAPTLLNNTQLVGTIRWMAPELLSLKPNYTTASDIYAYAVVLWELAMKEFPFPQCEESYLIHSIKTGEFFKTLLEKLELQINTPVEIKSIIQKSGAMQASERPTAKAMVSFLKRFGTFSILQQGELYPNQNSIQNDNVFENNLNYPSNNTQVNQKVNNNALYSNSNTFYHQGYQNTNNNNNNFENPNENLDEIFSGLNLMSDLTQPY